VVLRETPKGFVAPVTKVSEGGVEADKKVGSAGLTLSYYLAARLEKMTGSRRAYQERRFPTPSKLGKGGKKADDQGVADGDAALRDLHRNSSIS